MIDIINENVVLERTYATDSDDKVLERTYENNSEEVVKQYEITDAKYPYIAIPNTAISTPVVSFLKMLFTTVGTIKADLRKLYEENNVTYKDTDIHIYAYDDSEDSGRTIELGIITTQQVRGLLNVLSHTEITGYLNPETPIKAEELSILIQ